ncbi:MAG: DUF4124 domain-containing protein [Burkholderiales bacterium]|jgi:hypothetical protein|nr:DUF4124 domain-containing protein [Burkholderiales bacterium]
MKAVVIFLLWVLMTGSVSAAVYKCTGADGKIGFSDKPCVSADTAYFNQPLQNIAA